VHEFIIIDGEFFRISSLQSLPDGTFEILYWFPDKQNGLKLKRVIGKLNEISSSWFMLVDDDQKN
jgi:hypothetical protein